MAKEISQEQADRATKRAYQISLGFTGSVNGPWEDASPETDQGDQDLDAAMRELGMEKEAKELDALYSELAGECMEAQEKITNLQEKTNLRVEKLMNKFLTKAYKTWR